MTDHEASPTTYQPTPEQTPDPNFGDNNTVGIVASAVHNSNVYLTSPHDAPEQIFEAARNRLRAGFPAPEMFRTALTRGYDTAESRLHLVLALLSGRSLRDLTVHEREELRTASNVMHRYSDGQWKRSLVAVCNVIDAIEDPSKDAHSAIAAIHKTPPSHYAMIDKHLDLVMTGSKKDSFWAKRLESAQEEQRANNRTERIWAYFEPDPIGPRTRPPAAPDIAVADLAWAFLGSVIAALALGELALLSSADRLTLLSFLVMLAGGAVAAFNGAHWRYRFVQLERLSDVYFGRPQRTSAPEGGFTKHVGEGLDKYFRKYHPADLDPGRWMQRTAGLRAVLRDEICDLYREQHTTFPRVKWLVRFLARDASFSWQSGELFDFQLRYQTPSKTKACCAIGLVAFAFCGSDVIVGVAETSPLQAVIAVLFTGLGIRLAAPRLSDMYSERHRYADDLREQQATGDKRQNEFTRWTEKLSAIRPSEIEMESWLDADRTILLDKALRHYALTWHDVIAHSFLQSPADGAKRARDKGTLWRYSRYDLRLFLITRDGVREVSTKLDFYRARFHGEERSNYRFDAVSSVQVTVTAADKYTLRLTLNNGDPRDIFVAEKEDEEPSTEEDLPSFTKLNLAFAGFTPTLHLLEGIAAEGKNWIDYDPHRRTTAAGSSA